MRKPFLTLSAVALLGLAFVPSANAQLISTWDDRSYLTFSGPVSLPGVTLQAGRYLFTFPSRHSARSVIQVLSGDRTIVYAMMQTITIWRPKILHDPEVTFKETRADAPPAIRALFRPHSRIGYELLYPKAPIGTSATQVTGSPANWMMNAWRGKAAPPSNR